MTLSRFAIACGASPKWVQNAANRLGLSLCYTAAEARHLGLVRQIHAELGVPLEAANRFAIEALRDPALEPVAVANGSTVRLVVDVPRYLSDATVRLARAVSHHEPRRRGRRVSGSGGAVERARDYGWDIGQLETSLKTTAADRLRRLDENVEFVRALRTRR